MSDYISDYISRQAAIDSIWDGTNYDIYTKEVKEHLEELPTADVVEKDLLTDRPCAVCKYNTAEKGCTQWDCAFGI